MDNTRASNDIALTIDVAPKGDVLVLTLERDGQGIATCEVPYQRAPACRQAGVDNILLTAVDNLLKTNTLERSALTRVAAGRGIDKNSSLYRMVTSFASAVHACPPVGRTASATPRNGR